MKINTKKLFSLLFVLCCLAMLLPESLGMLLPQPKAAANEILAPAPVWRDKEGQWNLSALTELSDYLADRFAFRQPMISLWSHLHALSGSSPEPQVLQGCDGWLYYTETLPDFSGVSLPTDALAHVANNLSLMQEAAKTAGADFVFVIAPNKNSLYPDKMPDRFPARHAQSSAAQLLPLLAQRGVSAADLFAVFGAQDEVLYYVLDSHWNARGAALGADAILAAFNRESDFFTAPFSGTQPHRGDLYEMLYPTGKLCEDDPLPAAPFRHQTKGDPRGGEAITIETDCEGVNETLFCWRDSFGNALYPYLAESFSHATFSRSASYDLRRAEGANCVILEIVERNLPRLWENAPLFAAPDREMPEAREMTASLSASSSDSKGWLQISLALPRELLSGNTPPLLVLNGQAYACCVNAMEDTELALISACVAGETPNSLALIIEQNGELFRYPVELNPEMTGETP